MKHNLGIFIIHKDGTREEILKFSDYYSTGRHLVITKDNKYVYNDNEKRWYMLNNKTNIKEKIDNFQVILSRR